MSWPTTWHSTAPSLASEVSRPSIHSTVLPNVVNPTPGLLPPTAAGFPAGMQYSPEQWAQMQQHNWQQWAQWQQQYQQWHQQYGAEYQASMNALSTTTGASAPPPLPNESKPPPPPPPDDSLKPGQYNVGPTGSSSGYSTISPSSQHFTSRPPPTSYSNKYPNEWHNSGGIKRHLSQSEEQDSNKRKIVENISQGNNQNPSLNENVQNQTVSAANSQVQKNLDELTEAEKKFDKEFAAWEAQFNKWKNQNANHPDKSQYLEYEKKWESWRNSLLDRREQMRKKRLTLQTSMSANVFKPTTQSPDQTFNQPVHLNPKDQLADELFSKPPPTQNNELFSKPPPTQNNEPLFSKQFSNYPEDNTQNENSDVSNTFLKPSSQGGIPGLDLVKEGIVQSTVVDNQSETNDTSTPTKSKGPDLDAISKGINTILGDPKLLNMLSMVSQNHNNASEIPIENSVISDAPPPLHRATPHIPSLLNIPLNMPLQRPNIGRSGHSFDRHLEMYNSGELESVDNVQTRRSFSNDPYEQDFMFTNKPIGYNRSMANTDNRYVTERTNNEYDFVKKNNFVCSSDAPTTFTKSGSFENTNVLGRNSNDFEDLSPHKRLNVAYNNRYNEKYENSHKYVEDGLDETWNEEDEFEKYHNMFNEEEPSENASSFHPHHNMFNEEEPPENASSFHPHHNMFNEEEPSENVSSFHPVEVPSENTDILLNQECPANDDVQLFVPEVVVDYEHKSLKVPEPEVSLDLGRMFDYRHKPVNRIPYPQRPIWLSSSLRNIKQFDPLGTGRFGSIDRPSQIEGNEQFDRQSVRQTTVDSRVVNSSNTYGYSRDRYSELKNDWRSPNDKDFDREKEISRHDFSLRRSRDTNFRQIGANMCKNQNSNERGDYIQRLEKPMDLEELSDDDWVDDTNYAKRDKIKFSPPQINKDVTSLDRPNSVNPSTNITFNQNTTLEDLINPPGRFNRPPKIVIILRGPPGSGKTYLAKLIKDREVEFGGSAPRILSLDDYFMVEHEKQVIEDGKAVIVKDMSYEYEAEMEESYQKSLIKAFKKTIVEGYFHFVVVDNVNQKVRSFGEMWSFAKQKGFQVYICQLDLDPELCTRRNIHHRSESYIEDCIAGWEPTPSHHPLLDSTNFLQSVGLITEVEMEESEQTQTDYTRPFSQAHVQGKWDTFDCSSNNLARLDGVNKPIRHSRTMEEYLQPDNEWEDPCESPDQKRVRWADVEEQKQQKKVKALGFVVGQTDWKRITDTTNGESALVETKYIERKFK